MLTEKEYSDLLNHLIDKLRDMNAIETINEIRQLIGSGKTIEVKDKIELREKKIRENEVGKTRNLPLESKEAFEIVLRYLEHVIANIPLYGQRITKTFGSNVNWEFDRGEVFEYLYVDETLNINRFIFDQTEIDNVKSEFSKIRKDVIE